MVGELERNLSLQWDLNPQPSVTKLLQLYTVPVICININYRIESNDPLYRQNNLELSKAVIMRINTY